MYNNSYTSREENPKDFRELKDRDNRLNTVLREGTTVNTRVVSTQDKQIVEVKDVIDPCKIRH